MSNMIVGVDRPKSPRKRMLEERAKEQRSRTAGFTPMYQKPRNWPATKKYNPAGEKRDAR